jgi:hypothetical protein
MDSMAGPAGLDCPEHNRMRQTPAELSGPRKLGVVAAAVVVKAPAVVVTAPAVVVKAPTGPLRRAIGLRREANRQELVGIG